MNKTHGLNGHPLYNRWMGMKARCYNKNNKKYHRYGGAGVAVCDEWVNDFKAFFDWAVSNGWKNGLQIDKDIKAQKVGKIGLVYSPEWCSIVSNEENINHRKTSVFIEINGEFKNITQWCKEYGVKQSTYYSRIKTGWTMMESLTTPAKYVNRNPIHPKPKINMKIAEKIRKMHKTGRSNIKIAKIFMVDASTVSTIVNNKSWLK